MRLYRVGMALSPKVKAARNRFRERIRWHLDQIAKLKRCLLLKRCPMCGNRFQPGRLDQRCCKAKCSVKLYRRDKK